MNEQRVSSGAAWMVLASFLFGLMGVSVKYGAQFFSAYELVFYRTLFGTAVVGAGVWWRGATWRTPHYVVHLKRSVMGYAALLFYFYAMTHLPLGTAVTLNYTSPLFLGLISTVWLKERPPALQMVALGLGFIAAVMLLRPTWSDEAWLAGVAGLCSGFLAGFAYLHVRELGQLGEPEWRIVFYFCVVSTLGGALVLGVLGDLHPLTWSNVPILLALGTSATLAQLAMTRAYGRGDKLVVASFSYATIAFSAVFGGILWEGWLPWDSYFAMVLMVCAGVLAARSRR